MASIIKQDAALVSSPAGPEGSGGGFDAVVRASRPRARPPGQALSGVQDVISRYVDQLLNGCGDPKCINSLCDTGRRNSSQRPVRKYTPRSARTIALTLAGSPKPRSYFCKTPAQGSTLAAEEASIEAERDPAAFSQLLCDTTVIRNVCQAVSHGAVETPEVQMLSNLGNTEPDSEFRNWHAILDSSSANNRPRQPGLYEREALRRAVVNIHDCIMWLLNRLPTGRQSQWKRAIELINSGCISPDKNGDTPSDPSFNNWLYLLDALEHGPSFRLFCRALKEASKWCAHEPEYMSPACDPPLISQDIHPIDTHILWSLQYRLCHLLQKSENVMSVRLALIAWLKKAFLRFWDCKPLRGQNLVPFVALFLLQRVLEIQDLKDLPTLSYITTIRAVARRLSIVDVADTWLKGPHEDHVLRFSFIFTLNQQVTYFRGINSARMAVATSNSRRVSELRARHPRASDHWLRQPAILKFLEGSYLLLNVSRGDVLKDAFDQLWQRRRSELFRPLRVRLGEMDTFEIGHDLGGVQIEFFNLLCKELFRESAQIFTTDPTTGYSYFRAGSLHPLYMFELCGLAFALALYNGISIPVNFPQAFYLTLTGGQLVETDQIADAWPAISRSLENMRHEVITGLDDVLPLEANGLRLTVWRSEHPPNWWDLDSSLMYVVDATPIAHHEEGPRKQSAANDISTFPSPPSSLTILEQIEHAWPGWHIIPSPSEPPELEPHNKQAYITRYIRWLTHDSIRPQWTSFLRGFNILFPHPYPSIFSSWENLRSVLEGSPDFSISDLRSITHYESGYCEHQKYIQHFWRLVESWEVEKQRALLKFVTACERVPAGGASSLTFRIKRAPVADAEEGRLPTSSTCFGTLVLPKYESVQVLEQKLSLALKYGVEGFGSA